MIIATLLLLIPLSMVKSQIKERGNTMQESISDIESSWGEEQCLSGPKIRFEYDMQRNDKEGKMVTENLKDLEKGTLTISMSDLRGIEGEASIDFNGRKYDFIEL